MRVAYADPPYPGCAHLYRDHPDYAGEVDHAELVLRLVTEYDGFCLHTSSVALGRVLGLFEAARVEPRVMAWVKPFAAFKRNVPVAYAWEPVLVKACRKPVVKPGMTYRDWIAEPITLKRGLTGAKPEAVCRWAIGDTTFSHWFERCLKKAGVDYLSPHTTRHTYHELMRRAGLSLEERQVLMGHASIRTTADIYGHLNLDDVADKLAAFRLEDL